MDAETSAKSKLREGKLVEFLHRNLFRVKLSHGNGASIVAVMPDELIPSFDPNVQLTRYNYPIVIVELRDPPQLPKIVDLQGPGGWSGEIPKRFFEYEE